MGALVTRALRPIRTFNVENRAHRIISKEKPTPAPKYPRIMDDLKRASEADPKLDEKLQKKDPELDNRLKDIYVTSYGTPEDDITRHKMQQNPNRPLPQDRKQLPDYEYGFKEPDKIPYGQTTLKNVMTFLSAHQANPQEVTVARIAAEYKLKMEDVDNIVKFFKTYEIYIPETKNTKAIFAGPGTWREQLEKDQTKVIENDKSGGIENSKDIEAIYNDETMKPNKTFEK